MREYNGEEVIWQSNDDDSRSNIFLTETAAGLVRLSYVYDGETEAQFPMLGNKLYEMASFIVKDAF